MSLKKILLIIPEMSMGGAQRSLSKLSLELSGQHQVYLVVFNTNHKIEYSYGGDLLSLDVVPGTGVVNKTIAFLQRIVRLRKIKKKLGVDVSISFLEGADYINVLSQRLDKVIISIRGSKRHDETILGRFHFIRNRILIPWLYRKADSLVTVNKGIANELKTYYGLKNSNIVTIGNFYDRHEILLLAAESKSAKIAELYRSPILVTSGRLSPEKGLDSIIKVFYRIKKVKPDVKLVIVGDGPCYDELMASCLELKLHIETRLDFEEIQDVLFTGAQSNVFKYLTGATFYLMNSSSEGFPNGLVEAMICKVPVISSDCPYGPREILEPDFPFSSPVTKPYHSNRGVLMPIIKSVEDEECWTETIVELFDQREVLFQMAEQASLRASFFEKMNVMQKWQNIL